MKLVPTGERGPGGFGASVAVSANGRTALIGGPSGYGGVGAAWVFSRTGSGWRQTAKLTPNGLSAPTGYVANPDGFGASVALSANGKIAFVGGPGSRWRTRVDLGVRNLRLAWRQQGPELIAEGEAGTGQFGASVAVSALGDLAIVGAPFDDNGRGAAWVFRRAGSVWRQQGGKLVGGGELGFGRFGTSVALSADGTIALVGAPVDRNGAGAAWVFRRAATGGSELGAKLTPKGELGAGQFGDRVALSAPGTTALIGGGLDHGERGAAWIFALHGSGWAQEGAKLSGRGEVGEGQFGVAVALSAAAGTALIGGSGDGSFAGAAWAFRR